MKYQHKYSLTTVILFLVIMVAGFIGWIMNIVKIFGLSMDNLGEVVVRVIGVFVPFVGAISGYF